MITLIRMLFVSVVPSAIVEIGVGNCFRITHLDHHAAPSYSTLLNERREDAQWSPENPVKEQQASGELENAAHLAAPIGLANLLIIWDSIPHYGAGADLLMRRIFLDYPSEKLWALSTASAAHSAASRGSIVSVNHLFTAPHLQIHRRLLWPFSRAISWLLMPMIVWRGVRLVRQFGIEAIFTVPWNPFFVAAYFIHRITNVALYIYVMDDHGGKTRRSFPLSSLYAFFMPRAIRSARRVWCVSEGMRNSIAARFQKQSLLLLPTAELGKFQIGSKERAGARRDAGTLSILYTGAIYGMQLDALNRLVRILDRKNDPGVAAQEISLTLYTSASTDYLRKIGLTLGPNARVDKVEHEEMPRTLAKSDILFLPMSFEPRMKHIVSTSIPSKIAEYLASGVPILAHGPAYCSAVRYCREFDCGLVVDQPDDAALRDALIRLATDTELRKHLSANAVEAARKNHDAPIVVANFLDELCESAN
jgi:glycosyltransferase involved in cell wall biosynthesis